MNDTLKYGFPAHPSPPRSRDEDIKRIDKTLVDLRDELDQYTKMQKRGNKINLETQGGLRRLEKKVEEGFRLVIKLLKDK